MNSFKETEKFAMEIANMTLSNLSQKQAIKEIIIKEIALCCLKYNKIPNYRKEVDEFIKFQRIKEKNGW